MYCNAPATSPAPVEAPPRPAVASLPPGRPGSLAEVGISAGSSAAAFAHTAELFLKERLGELTDPSRIARTHWIAAPPQHPAWPYVSPDHEVFFDVVTADGVGYLLRYAGEDAALLAHADDLLFAPIQALLPFTRVDLEAVGLMLFLGTLREVVIVTNADLDASFVDRVGRMNRHVAAQAGATGRDIRLVSFTWELTNRDEWKTVERGRPSTATAPSSGDPSEAALVATRGGNRLAEQGRLDEALRAHDEAIRLDPGCALAWSNRSYVLANLERFAASLAAAERALSLDAKLEQAWINVSQALIGLGRFPEALQVAQRGLAVAPRSAALHFNAALSADRTYRQPVAVTHYRSFIEVATPAMKREVELAQQRLRVFRA